MNFWVVDEDGLTSKQRRDRKRLQVLCFGNIDLREIEEDFYNLEIANVLAYVGDKLIGWAGIHQVEVEFEGKKISLGGFGICTHPEWRKKGVATKVSQAAMDFLRKQGCDMAFLSVDPADEISKRLHQKTGFVGLLRKFSWTNKYGVLKESEGGMIAPLGSRELFEQVLNGKELFYVGKGYW